MVTDIVSCCSILDLNGLFTKIKTKTWIAKLFYILFILQYLYSTIFALQLLISLNNLKHNNYKIASKIAFIISVENASDRVSYKNYNKIIYRNIVVNHNHSADYASGTLTVQRKRKSSTPDDF